MEINPSEFKNNWQVEDGRLKLSVKLDDFTACVKKVNEISNIAEEQDHHPDLSITSYKNLGIELYTHDEGAITEKDIRLAKAIDEIV